MRNVAAGAAFEDDAARSFAAYLRQRHPGPGRTGRQ
jgi:hypothetical protein